MFNNLIKTASKFADNVAKYSRKHQSEILAGIGIAGYLSSIVLAVKATPAAYENIKRAEIPKDYAEYYDNPEKINLTFGEKIKLVWKDYIPTAITCATSTVCVISSVSTACRRSAVLATAYTLAEESAKEYRDKVVEVIGEKKEKKIREEIAEDKIKKNPPVNTQIVFTNQGNALVYETISGRYFKFDIDKIHKVESRINKELSNENYISLNKLFYYFGLDSVDMGDELGWSSEDGYLEFEYSSKLTVDDEPCMVLSYSRNPKAGYSIFY